ncbi:MAG: DUF3597 domain-containing protein [Anaerolineales bacterium]|nr:DUF3597 domain-containing protein [Anaerolineales bacterium]
MFSKVLNKLGLGKKKEENKEATATKPAAKPAPKKVNVNAVTRKFSSKNSPIKKAASSQMEMVDVMSKLESMAKGSGLNWKKSIVDLLKVLDIDSSFSARKELATELGCPADLMGDSAKMNTWLHKTVLQKIAENGGNIPQSLLD